tara:strand:+ start:157 stop:447 length:291 start_codon:yes stop_codon:yes gene_type:complete
MKNLIISITLIILFSIFGINASFAQQNLEGWRDGDYIEMRDTYTGEEYSGYVDQNGYFDATNRSTGETLQGEIDNYSGSIYGRNRDTGESLRGYVD